mgnify:CR=1 FL=1
MVNDVTDHRARSVVFFIMFGDSEHSGRGLGVVPKDLSIVPIIQLPED